MSEEKLGLELLGARVVALTAEVRDLQHRFSAVESRFSALESRFTAMETRLGGIESCLGVIEDRMSSMLSLIVRIAERLDGQVHNPQSVSGLASRRNCRPFRDGSRSRGRRSTGDNHIEISGRDLR